MMFFWDGKNHAKCWTRVLSYNIYIHDKFICLTYSQLQGKATWKRTPVNDRNSELTLLETNIIYLKVSGGTGGTSPGYSLS